MLAVDGLALLMRAPEIQPSGSGAGDEAVAMDAGPGSAGGG